METQLNGCDYTADPLGNIIPITPVQADRLPPCTILPTLTIRNPAPGMPNDEDKPRVSNQQIVSNQQTVSNQQPVCTTPPHVGKRRSKLGLNGAANRLNTGRRPPPGVANAASASAPGGGRPSFQFSKAAAFKRCDSLQPPLFETLRLAPGVTLICEGERSRSGGARAADREHMSHEEFERHMRSTAARARGAAMAS